MSKQTNPALVGAFVIGALLLLSLGFALFGGAELLSKKVRFTTYFEGSVQGLRVGSNILFRGVRVGSVSNIELLTEVDTLQPLVRVTMQLEPSSIKILRGERLLEGGLSDMVGIERLLAGGLSAQLVSESFVTGQLAVALDFRPDRELQLRGVDAPYPEIPGMPSDVQQVLNQFQEAIAGIQENVDLGMLVKDLHGALSGINRLVNDEETQALAGEVNATLTELRTAATSASRTFATLEQSSGQLTAELKPAVVRLNSALTEAEQMLQSLRRQLDGNSDQTHQLQSTLAELESASRSARNLFDYLQRHPEALLKGKSQ